MLAGACFRGKTFPGDNGLQREDNEGCLQLDLSRQVHGCSVRDMCGLGTRATVSGTSVILMQPRVALAMHPGCMHGAKPPLLSTLGWAQSRG